jgi:hypothetical protein
MSPAIKPICSTIKVRFLSAECSVCGRRPPDRVHIVKGVYYCALDCPVHRDDQHDVERSAIQEVDLGGAA